MIDAASVSGLEEPGCTREVGRVGFGAQVDIPIAVEADIVRAYELGTPTAAKQG
jgi:hypothetical protein